MGTIVVGVDGSEASKRALSWALEEAALRGSPLRVLHAWLGSAPPAAIDAIQREHPDIDVAAEPRSFLRGVVDEVAGPSPAVDISQEVVQSTAASMLLAASRQADLLVVGSRGVGGFHGLLLGSVSLQCAHHAGCPVVIVPVRSTD